MSSDICQALGAVGRTPTEKRYRLRLLCPARSGTFPLTPAGGILMRYCCAHSLSVLARRFGLICGMARPIPGPAGLRHAYRFTQAILSLTRQFLRPSD